MGAISSSATVDAREHDAASAGYVQRWRQKWRRATGRSAVAADSVELVQSRIYLLPSGRGMFLIVTALLLLLVGINYQLSLAFVVAFLLAGLMQAALLASWRNLHGLRVLAGRSPQTQPGEPLRFALTLVSPERSRHGIRLDARIDGEAIHCAPLLAQADGTIAATLAIIARQRGIVRLGRVTVETRAPYGLVRAWSYVHFDWAGIVEATPEKPSPPLPLAGGADEQHAPAAREHAAHDPDTLRDYVAGDSLRRVAWKQVAKSGRWYTRSSESGARQEVAIEWSAAALPDTEARLARIAAWIDRADNEGCAFTLRLPNGGLELAGGAQQCADARRLLAVFPERIDAVSGLR